MKVSILSFINDCLEKKRNRKRESERERQIQRKERNLEKEKKFLMKNWSY